MFAADEILLCFVYFVVSLIFWQALLLWVFPQSPVFWKRVDYYWLGVAFIGILTAVQAYSIDQKKQHREAAETAFINHYRLIESILKDGEKINCKPMNFSVCNWYVLQLGELYLPSFNRFQGRNLTQKFELGMLKPPSVMGSIVHERLKREIKAYCMSLSRLKEAEQEEDARITWKEFASYVPAFLILLLTLRITKVTADSMMEQDRDRKPSRFNKGPPHWGKCKKSFIFSDFDVKPRYIVLSIIGSPFVFAVVIWIWQMIAH
jgi:hypothetical protein